MALRVGINGYGRTGVNRARQAAPAGPLKGILAYHDLPLVSVDFNHDARSSVFDGTLVKVRIDTTLARSQAS